MARTHVITLTPRQAAMVFDACNAYREEFDTASDTASLPYTPRQRIALGEAIAELARTLRTRAGG